MLLQGISSHLGKTLGKMSCFIWWQLFWYSGTKCFQKYLLDHGDYLKLQVLVSYSRYINYTIVYSYNNKPPLWNKHLHGFVYQFVCLSLFLTIFLWVLHPLSLAETFGYFFFLSIFLSLFLSLSILSLSLNDDTYRYFIRTGEWYWLYYCRGINIRVKLQQARLF